MKDMNEENTPTKPLDEAALHDAPCSAILAANATALLIAGIRADIIMFAAIIMALDSDNKAFSAIMIVCSFVALLGGFHARRKHEALVRRQNAKHIARHE